MCSVVSVHFNNNTEHYKITKQQSEMNKLKSNQSRVVQTQTQETNTHATQVEKGYLSMILNQRQLTTPASD